MKYFIPVFTLVFGLLIGYFLNYFIQKPNNPMPENTQQILLESIKKVAKLVTIEGEFSNIHQYNDFYWSDISFLRKKALIKVKAKVSVGFNLEQIEYIPDKKNKILYIKNLPEPEIISIDHTLQYYDIQEGLFNNFTEKELNSINNVVKEKLKQKAINSPLFMKAYESGLENLNIIKILTQQAGWTLEIIDNSIENSKVKIENNVITKENTLLN